MMQWSDLKDRMDSSIFKIDGTAIDNAYFMATHMPFSKLKVLDAGKGYGGESDFVGHEMSEIDAYHHFMDGRKGKHQLIVIQGEPGIGKSHLIAWMHNKVVNEKYDDEEVVFLRRLDNTVRKALEQILDQNIIKNKEISDKIRKFVNSLSGETPEQIKTRLYDEYTNALEFRPEAYGENKPTKGKQKDIVEFLRDETIRKYFMRDNGPVERCYKLLNASAREAGEGEVIWSDADFDFPAEVQNAIRHDSGKRVKNFYLSELRHEKNGEKIKKQMTDALNRMTPDALQSCAGITSDTARSIFEELRRELQREGKSLTLFIEDVTSLAMLDRELLLVLSIEKGGKYTDLCEITTVIGVTGKYYQTYHDNFFHRVTGKIEMTESSFATDEFIPGLTARYLNACYTDYDELAAWAKGGSDEGQLPTTDFKPPYEWDSVDINGKAVTLYPFNRRSVISLFARLKSKTPRDFLRDVVRNLFCQFAMDMGSDGEMRFPKLYSSFEDKYLSPVYMKTIENSELSELDRARLNTILTTWGDETAVDDGAHIGGVAKPFLEDIGLAINRGTVIAASPSNPMSTESDKKMEKAVPLVKVTAGPAIVRPEEKEYQKNKADLEAWLYNSQVLGNGSAYRKAVTDFVYKGINWANEGIPFGYLDTLWKNQARGGGLVYIEGDTAKNDKASAFVVLERSPETFNLLMALEEFKRYKGQEFPELLYNQYVLSSWLLMNKEKIKERITAGCFGRRQHPIARWGLAAEYLCRCLYGDILPTAPPLLAGELLKNNPYRDEVHHSNEKWRDAWTGLFNDSDFKNNRDMLRAGSNTKKQEQGKETGGNYRVDEIFLTLEALKAADWDIRKECETIKDGGGAFFLPLRFLRRIYKKIKSIVEEEKIRAAKVTEELKKYIGDNCDEDAFRHLYEGIDSFKESCKKYNQSYDEELMRNFLSGNREGIVHKMTACVKLLQEVQDREDAVGIIRDFNKDPVNIIRMLVEDLKKLETHVTRISAQCNISSEAIDEISDDKIEEMVSEIEGIERVLEKSEAKNDFEFAE